MDRDYSSKDNSIVTKTSQSYYTEPLIRSITDKETKHNTLQRYLLEDDEDELESNSYEFISRVKDLLNTSDIIMVEGYEMVGKTTFIEVLENYLKTRDTCDDPSITRDVITYKTDYKLIKYDDILGVTNRGAIGLPVVELFINNILPNNRHSVLVLDRSILSTLVYNIYDFTTDPILEGFSSILNKYRTNITLLYLFHKDKDSAESKYISSISDGNHEDKFDKFKDFDDYYENYLSYDTLYRLQMDKLFDKIEFRMIGIPV